MQETRREYQTLDHMKVVKGLMPGNLGPRPSIKRIQMIDSKQSLLQNMEKILQRNNKAKDDDA